MQYTIKGNNESIQCTVLCVSLPHSQNQVTSSEGMNSAEASRPECSNVHQYVSLCYRDVWQLSVGADRKEESSVLSQRRETAHCVNDELERDTRTADFIADIRSLRRSHRTCESSHGLVGVEAPVSSFNLVRAARHPHKTPPLFCSHSFPASLQSACFCDPSWDGRGRKNHSVAVPLLGCECKVAKVN